jgi:dTDP-4-amino-4,6-dideoxygalactose transaminase
MGATTKEFEERISEFLALRVDRHVVATNTGTSAFHIALLAAGVGPGDEVITPSFNYVADHQAVRMCGADVVMCDIREADLGIDVEQAALLVTKRTKAIIPLHFAGIACDREGVYALGRAHGLRVIEDACHAFGTTVGGVKIGADGDVAVFSFDPVKVVTAVDGGCVVGGRADEMTRLQRMRLLGVDKDTTERYRNRRAWEYDVVSPGFRYHLTNILASVGISQLKRADEFIRSRQQVCKAYNAAFDGLPCFVTPRSDFSDVSPFIYSLRVSDGRRARFIEHMSARDIDCGIHFVPVHRHQYFKDARCGDLRVTERIVDEVTTLPLHSNMRPEFVERVIEGVRSFVA